MKKSFTEAAYISPAASLSGDVRLGKDSSVWHGAVLRGDLAPVSVGSRTNVQDGAILHVADDLPCLVGDDVTIGHGAIVHGCRIGNRCLIGMGSIILNGAVIGDECVIGAGALVTERKEIPPRSLVVGNPGKIIRQLSDEHVGKVLHSAQIYVELARKAAGNKAQTGNDAAYPRDAPARVPRLASVAELYGNDFAPEQIARYEGLVRKFHSHFPGSPERKTSLYSAPGRTELCGNHTDHNLGRVLAAAINLDSIAAVAPRGDAFVRLVSEGFGECLVDISDTTFKPEEKGSSVALIRGLARALSNRANGKTLVGFDAYVSSSVLPGSGLSSSASFEVLMGAILADQAGIEMTPSDLASAGQFAENEYFGKPCGLMDQMACALGSVVEIDFEKPGSVSAGLMRFDPGEFGFTLVIVNTGGSHADLTEDYAAIPSEMKAVAAMFGHTALRGIKASDILARAREIREKLGDRAFLRAWHFINENERPPAMASAIARGDMQSFLDIVRESGDSSWRYLQNLSPGTLPSEQGLGLALAITEGFLAGKGASRVHGGGFAGTIQAYIPAERFEEYKNVMEPLFGTNSVYLLRFRPYGVVCIDQIAGRA